jgi:hypothetical protein
MRDGGPTAVRCSGRRALEVDQFAENKKVHDEHFKELESWGTTEICFPLFPLCRTLWRLGAWCVSFRWVLS